LAAQAKADLRQSSNTLLIRRGVDSGRKAATRKEVGQACGQCVTLLSRPGGYGPAPNPSNTLLIRRGVDSGRQAVMEEGGRSACRQCVTLLSRPGIGEC
jgi:threonine/homoserine/homoserine lactone efflux protein